MARGQRPSNRTFFIALARAGGGAIVFSLPLLMTMEMWELGGSMRRGRLLLMLTVLLPLLVRLSYYVGFEDTFDWKNDVVDAFVALAVGFGMSAALLRILGVLRSGTSLDAAVGMLAFQAVPASIGAMLAHAQLGKTTQEEQRERQAGYWGELFLMGVGALFLAFNVAPTEEVLRLAHGLTALQALALLFLALLVMHAFVYAVEFRGGAVVPPGTSVWSIFVRYTLAGYGLCLLVSAYILWTIGRLDGLEFQAIVANSVVLGFPAAVGAAAARLVL